MSDNKWGEQKLPAHLESKAEDQPSAPASGSKAGQTRKRSNSRSVARLAAVQALYQRHMEVLPTARLLAEFHQHRLGKLIEDEQYAEAEVEFFDDVVSGVIERHEEIDEAITSKLADGWSIVRLDKTMLQILRAGTYELLARKDVPTGTVISEYVDVAHAFFDKREARFVNGVLDAIGKVLRAKGSKPKPAPAAPAAQAPAEPEAPSEPIEPDSDLAG